MRELLGVNGNRLYAGEDKEPLYEIIILTTEPKYRLENEEDKYQLTKHTVVEELRFFTQGKHLVKLAEQILALKELK